MKVLITGKTSRIGGRLQQHLEQNGMQADMVSMRDDSWKQTDLSVYDAVVHAAAMVHQAEQDGELDAYLKVNADLTEELAQKAKEAGVKKFVFLSTMAVYGMEGTFGNDAVITKNTPTNPTSLYGKSKLEGENRILPLADETFFVSALRAPLVYGKNCKGNYARFEQMAMKLPALPYFDNQRSMLHVVNLCEFIRLWLETPQSGVFFPQNREYVNTTEMMQKIAQANGKSGKVSRFLGGLAGIFKGMGLVRKAFGNLVYAKDMSDTFGFAYDIVPFEDSFRD